MFVSLRLGFFSPLPVVSFRFSFVETSSIAFPTQYTSVVYPSPSTFYAEPNKTGGVAGLGKGAAMGHKIVPTLSIVMETPHSVVVRG